MKKDDRLNNLGSIAFFKNDIEKIVKERVFSKTILNVRYIYALNCKILIINIKKKY